MIGKTLAQVSRRQSTPGNVCYITRNVIERAGINVRLVGESEKRDARSDAGSEDSNSFVTLIL